MGFAGSSSHVHAQHVQPVLIDSRREIPLDIAARLLVPQVEQAAPVQRFMSFEHVLREGVGDVGVGGDALGLEPDDEADRVRRGVAGLLVAVGETVI